MTCSLKKMKGLESDKDKRRMHQVGIFKGISDINTVFKPALTVVDAILCQEGLGPIFGRPVEMDLVVAGKDPVAVGQCVPLEKRGKRFVKGCPPNNVFIVQAIIGGREK